MGQGKQLAPLLAAMTSVTALDVSAEPISRVNAWCRVSGPKPARYGARKRLAASDGEDDDDDDDEGGSCVTRAKPLIACLAGMHSLQALRLGDLDPTPQLCDAVARLPALVSLQLDGLNLSAAQATELAPHLALVTRLTCLRLAGAPCALERGGVDVPLVPRLSALHQLKDLTLEFVFAPTVQHFKTCVGGMPGLTSLEVVGRVYAASAAAGRLLLIEHLAALPQLARLVLKCDMDMSAKTVVSCAQQLPGLRALRELHLEWFSISTQSVAALSRALKRMPHLTALTLKRAGGVCNLPNEPHVADVLRAPLSKNLTSLEYLSMTAVLLLPGMLVPFAQQLRSLTRLTALELDACLMPRYSYAMSHQFDDPYRMSAAEQAQPQPDAATGAAEKVAALSRIGSAVASLPALARVSFNTNTLSNGALVAFVTPLAGAPALTQLWLRGYIGNPDQPEALEALVPHVAVITRLVDLDLSARGGISEACALLLSQQLTALTLLTRLLLVGCMGDSERDICAPEHAQRVRVATALSRGLVALAPRLHLAPGESELLPQPARVIDLPGGRKRLDIKCLGLDDALGDPIAAAL